jgi:hypothetical protein
MHRMVASAANDACGVFGRDLASEFGIDPFTLVNTSCIY